MQPTAQAVGSGSAITAEPRKGRKTTNARTPTGRSTRSRSPAVSGGTATPRSTDPWTFPQHYAVTSDLAFHSPVATSWSQPKGKSQKSARMTMGSSNSRCFKILATLSQQRACPASRRLVSPTPSIFCKQVIAPQDFAQIRPQAKQSNLLQINNLRKHIEQFHLASRLQTSPIFNILPAYY